MLEIVDGVAMTIREAKTSKQTAIIKEFYCFMDKVLLIADKTTIQAGEDVSTITARWQKFNLETEVFENNVNNENDIILDINGRTVVLDDVNGGVSSMQFSSEETGHYVISSINHIVENTSIEVMVE